MNRRSRQFLTILLCAAITGITACGTTTQRIGPSEAAMNNYGISTGDVILVRYVNKDDPRSSSSSSRIRIAGIDESSLSGVAENGDVINVGYDEIFQIEYKKRGIKNLDEMPRLESALTAASAILIIPAIALAQYPGG